MSKREWTDEQKQAIHACWIDEEKTKRGNILVQAAAGSGKTAVLVERIIKKLIPEDINDAIDINRLLVVTFTNAAAGEMQERISDALSKELTKAISRGDFRKQKHLKRQLALLPSADITTIDAFCLKTIRNWFHLLNIDPDFSIMDSGELELLKDDAMEELFEAMYEEENPEFIDLLSMYTDGRDDRVLSEKIKNIYSFIQSFPDPEKWLYEKRDMFFKGENNFWVKEAIRNARISVKKGLKYLGDAADIILKSSLGEYDDLEKTMNLFPPCEENDVYLSWGSYYTAVYDEYFNMKKMQDAGWQEIYEISKIPYIDLRKKADFVDKDKQIKDKELKERVKNLRNMARDDAMRAGILKYISMPIDEVNSLLETKLSKTVSSLVGITLKFGNVYKNLKNEKNVMEFSDIEHLCLELFRNYPDVREEYKGNFLEILMDEYQDTNRLQEEIFLSISRGDNIFMVGDMKQSIYRFRSSDPTIFKEKSDLYKKDWYAENRKIILGKNFRSRKEILDSVNDVFELIMTEESGAIVYDEDQRLNVGDDKSYQENGCDYRSECIVIEEKGENDEDILKKASLEARVIAKRIRELKESAFKVRDNETISVADPKTGEIKKQTNTVYRELKNKDIVILMSSYKGVSDIYMEELSNAGIECFAENDGYFERNEIKLIMSLLKVIGNPYQDIPLLGVMRSPIGGFSDDDLVNIRLAGDGYIYSAAKILVEDFEKGKIGDEDTIKTAKRTQEFLRKLKKWRGYMTYMTSDKLLWTLYEETDIYGFVGALYGGEESRSNLRLLFERAKKYEKTGYKGLFNFVRYIGLLKKKSEDLSTATMVSENHDVVRIMTIHKSKGLEFPVVFLAGCGKRFNLRDTSGDLLLHKDAGFGLDYIDFEKSIKITNITKTVTAGIIRSESMAEEIRKLYVALTRAKEKLIVTATIPGRKEDFSGGADELEKKWGNIEEFNALSAVKFIDWIAPAAINTPEDWRYFAVKYKDAVEGVLQIEEEKEEAFGEGTNIERFMTYEYFYKDVSDIPSKISVSELKADNLSKSSYTQMTPVPEIMKPKKEIKGAQKGTVIHYVMQKIPFADNMNEQYVDKFVKSLQIKGSLTKEETDAVDSKKIAEFYNSPLGIRMRKSNKVWRERSFEIDISAKEISKDYPEEEKVILQGIIDCYFEEDGEYVLVDYKSDYYENPEEMREKYTTQLTLYADAIEKITEKKVKGKYLYLFFANDVLEL